MKSKVYFSRSITPEAVVKMYEQAGVKLKGNIAIKVHSGEVGNQNFIKPDFWQPIVEKVGGAVVECNTAYNGGRHNTKVHLKTIEKHGWNNYFKVDLLDGDGEDIVLEIPDGKRIKRNYIGNHTKNYDGTLILSHFKGHPMGGYGGALKQLSIGFASSYGKKYIHGAGVVEECWTSDHDSFLESMADAALSVVRYFKGNALYVNVMKNLSVDCDCCAKAEDPCMQDIGILLSTDPVAIDMACIDLVYKATDDKGQKHFIERIESRNGIHTIDVAAEHKIGSKEYELIEID